MRIGKLTIRLRETWTWLDQAMHSQFWTGPAPMPEPPPITATWDGKDFAAIQMLPARREQGIPACWVDTNTWDLRIRGYDGVVPVGSVITAADGELVVTRPAKVCIGCEREQGDGHEDWCPVVTGTLSTLPERNT